MDVPPLSAQQRADALVLAAEARKRRATIKEQLKTGELTLSGLFELADRDPIVAKMKVRGLLSSLPRVGQVTTERVMADIGISPTRRVRGLGCQQRQALLERFR